MLLSFQIMIKYVHSEKKNTDISQNSYFQQQQQKESSKFGKAAASVL